MICKPLVQTALQQQVHIVFVRSEFVEVIMEVFDIFVIGYVVADCRVARFRDEIVRLGILFRICAAIYSLFDDLPAQVVIGQLAFEDRC